MFAINSSASDFGACEDESLSTWGETKFSFKSWGAMMSLNSPSKVGNALLRAILFSSSSVRLEPWLLFLNLNKLPSSSSRSLSCSLKIFHLSRKIARIEATAWYILLSRKPCWIEWLRRWSIDRRKILQDIHKKGKFNKQISLHNTVSHCRVWDSINYWQTKTGDRCTCMQRVQKLKKPFRDLLDIWPILKLKDIVYTFR